MNELPTKLVGDLLSDDRGISVGVMYPGGDTPDGVPLIRAGDILDGAINPEPTYRISKEVHYEYRRTALVGGESLITLVGTPGQTVVVPKAMAGWNVARALAVVRLREPEDTKYFALAMSSPTVQDTIRNWCNTTVQPTLNLKEIKALPIPWPDKKTREAIADSIGALNDKIELNRQTNETLEAMARALFKDWFVDFGPTRSKSEGRKPYLAPELWDLFPDALDDDDKPVGWAVGSIADLADTNNQSWTARNHPPFVEYVDLSNAKWGNIDAITTLAWEEAPSRARRIVKAGDTIIGTTRPGNGSFAYVSQDGLTVSTGFAVLSPHKSVYRDVVHIAATRPDNIDRLANLADGHGGAYPAVKPNEVSDTELILPGDAVLNAFGKIVSPLREKIEHAKAESHSLAQTRDLLLPKLMSGEIRLRDAEKAVEAVV